MEPSDSPLLQRALLLEEAEQIASVGTFEWHLATDERVWTHGLWRIFGMEPRADGPTGARSSVGSTLTTARTSGDSKPR